MDCGELARALDPYLDGELAAPEQDGVEAHLRACPDCRATALREGHARTALRVQLRAAMGAGTRAGSAPAELRERIHLALAADRLAPRRRLTPFRTAALALGVVGLLVIGVLLHAHPDPVVEEAVRKHTHDLPLEVTAAAAGPDAVTSWFGGKLDFNASPPRFRTPIRVLGARLSHIRERPAAYLRYEAPRGQFGLFIFDDPERRFESTGRVVKIGPAAVRLASARGYGVAVWRRNDIVYTLVSDADEGDLAGLVEAAQPGSAR